MSRSCWLCLLALLLAPAPALDAQQAPLRTDLHGDPLPPGALARLGSIRFRQGGAVVDLALSPDGTTLAMAGSGSGGHTLRLLDATTGRELRRFPPPRYSVSHLVFSRDGKTLVGASGYDVHFWDANTGAKLRDWPAHPGGIGALALSPDGKTVAVSGGIWQGGKRHPIHVLDAATGKRLHELAGHEVCANWLGFSADGKRLASNSPPLRYESGGQIRTIPGAIYLWDVPSGKSLRRLESLNYQTIISPDHKTLASRRDAHADGITILQDVDSGKEIGRCAGDRYDHFLFSPDGKMLATAGHSGRLRLWDVATAKELRRLESNARVSLKAFSPDGKRLACVGDWYPDNSLVRIWDVATGTEIRPLGGHRAALTCVAVAPDGKTVVTGSNDRSVRLWEATTGKELRRFEGHAGAVAAVSFAPAGKVVASGGEDKTVHLWDTATGRELRRLAGHRAAVVSVAFAADGKTLLTGSDDGTLKLWDVAAGKEARPFGQVWTLLHHACFSADGKYMALCGRNRFRETALGVVRADSGKDLWTVRHERPQQTFKEMRYGFSLVYLTVAFSDDGRLLASSESTSRHRTGSLSGHAIRLWEVATGKEILKIEGFPYVATSLAFSPDSQTLVSGHGNDRQPVGYPTSDPFGAPAAPKDEPTIRFWDVPTGTERAHLRGHLSWARGVAFSPDGHTLVSAGADHTALVWDASHLPPPKPKAEVVTAKALEGLWADLAGAAAGAYRAIARLSTAPGQSVPLLRQRLRPAPPLDARRLAGLIANLDSSRFAVRQKATDELEKLAELAIPALRQALAGKPSLERWRRLDLLLQKAEGLVPNGEALRELRALAVLERIGNEEARGVLRALAGGEPDARLTQEAQTTLQRLGRRASRP